MTAVLVQRVADVTTVTFNRPERLNAVNEELYESVIAELVRADADADVRCVVLTGAGRAFCVGADLKAHGSRSRTPEQQANYLDLGQRVCEQIQTMDTPVIAAVNGYALGAGAEMAVSADFLVIASDAHMGFPEVSIGTFVGGGVTHRLPRLVGLRRATDMLILGERFTGSQALAWGLATLAPTADDFAHEVSSLATMIASKAPLSLSKMKQALRSDPTLAQALSDEPRQLSALMQTQDWAEGVRAFSERRPPVFAGI